jgi:hypothetical protein
MRTKSPPDSNSSGYLWIDNCPCLGCPYDENGECIDLEYSASCTYVEAWVLGLHSSDTNRKVKTRVIIKKPSFGRWELHSRHHANIKRQGW